MNWGDLNGDGRSDYVDQKIFDTQINPYSGEYQGDMFQQTPKTYYRRERSGLNLVDYVIIMGIWLVLFFVIMATPLAKAPELAGIILVALLIPIIFIFFNKVVKVREEKAKESKNRK